MEIINIIYKSNLKYILQNTFKKTIYLFKKS